MSTFTLYRFFDAEDTLLYVGLTVNPGRRMEKHRAMQPWWNDVARIEMEQHPDLATLRAAEREAIKAEKPLYNISMNGVQHKTRLTWECEACRKPIEDHDGYVTVSYSDLGEHARAINAAETAGQEIGGLRVVNLATYPSVVRWHVLHRRCDPNPESTDYWIGVERIRTTADVIHWSAHLLGKRWIQNTNWASLIRSIPDEATG